MLTRKFFTRLISWINDFLQRDYYSKASALTFYSLLSIVPVLAVAFGVAKGFGFDENLKEEILNHFQEQQEIANYLIQFAYSLLKHAQGGIIAGVGILFLFWSVFTLFSNIESTLNQIWNVRVSRAFMRRFSDYLAMMLICPIIFLASSSLTVYISTQVAETAKTSEFVHAISPLFFFALRLSPFVLSWLLFSFLYLFVPNTKVSFFSGLAAGILAGTAFQLWQWLYIYFQSSISSYGAIYGSFAALPLFLLWLQYSWFIVLVGALVSFEIENGLSLPSSRLGPTRLACAKLLSLNVVLHCIHAFSNGKPPLNDHDLVRLTGTPLNAIRNVLTILKGGNLLAEEVSGYQPARDIHKITLQDVCEAVDRSLAFVAPLQETEQVKRLDHSLQQLIQTAAASKENIPLYRILETGD